MITEAVHPDEKLPSVRELAARLAINPNTISRAYKELEKEGYVYSVCGKGTFVSDTTKIKEDRKKELLAQFDAVTMELNCLSVETEELLKRLEQMGKGEHTP